MNRLTGKCALITGGASGIGLATARRFLEEDAQVVITDIDSEKGERASMELARRARFLTHDVTSETSWDQAVATTTQTLGGFNVLVNCAGVLTTGNIEQTSFEMWRRTLGINLDGTFLGCRAAVREMRDGGGSIVNLSSVSGMIGHPDSPAYDASKGGVRLLTKSVALHCARERYGIRCNSVHPAGTYTSMAETHFAAQGDPRAEEQVWIDTVPIGRMAGPDEIAGLIVYLASDEASFVTGAEFVIDGGKTAQ